MKINEIRQLVQGLLPNGLGEADAKKILSGVVGKAVKGKQVVKMNRAQAEQLRKVAKEFGGAFTAKGKEALESRTEVKLFEPTPAQMRSAPKRQMGVADAYPVVDRYQAELREASNRDSNFVYRRAAVANAEKNMVRAWGSIDRDEIERERRNIEAMYPYPDR